MANLFADRYDVIRELGRGGFGIVHLAHDSRLKGRPVALKVLHPALSTDPAVLRLFEDEAGTLASLTNEHIVPVFDAGVCEGWRYIVMQYVDGPSLAQVVKEQGAQPAEQVIAWLRQAAGALACAHERGVLHRDIKSANLLLDAQHDRLYISDFGLARAAEVSGGSSQVHTGTLTGTAAYRAPEVTRSGHTFASDLYGLGVVAYELLAGRLPFLSDDPLSMLMLHATEPAPPLPNGVPSELAGLVMRLLAKEPSQRPAGAGALVAALSRLSQPAKTPVSAAVTSGSPRHDDVPAPAPTGLPAGAAAHPRPRWVWPAVGVGGVALLVVLALVIKGAIGGDQTMPDAMSSTAAASATPSLMVQAPAASTTPLPQTTTALPLTATAVQPTLTSVPQPPTPTPGIGTTLLGDRDGMTLVYVPAGEFVMGAAANDSAASPDEKPQHPVALDAFWIDRTEVTNAQYRKCIEAGICRRPQSPETNYEDPVFDTYPIVNVSWYDAQTYCQWAQRRLPTEAEWEKAARGTDGRTYPWGNNSVAGDKVNFCDKHCSYTWRSRQIDDGYAWTSPVGHYLNGASPYSALDMAGNVWEWVADWYDAKYYSDSLAENPLGPDSGKEKVLRGGSWYDYAGHVRTTRRTKDDPVAFDGNIGLRCARSTDTDQIINPSFTPAGSGPATTSGRSIATAIPAAANVLTLTLASGVLLELIRVPEGEFLMGSNKTADPLALDAELPQHSVSQESYWIGKYEVTVAQFAAFVRATRYETTAERLGSGWTWIDRKWQEVAGADWSHPSGPGSNIEGKENHPVTLVSWDDAVAFCRWATGTTGRTLRLPSEAEWEKAARGTDGRIYPWGNTPPNAQRVNYNNVNGTNSVGQYPLGVGPYGALDMAGNVWEWTSSLYRGYPYEGNDGREAQDDRGTRVLRGGSFLNEAQNVRSAVRLTYFPDDRYANFGFRVASAGF